MTIQLNQNQFFIFDLDDTLFQEIDFLKSAYRTIAKELSVHIGSDLYEQMWSRYKNKQEVFGWVISEFGSLLPDYRINDLLKLYREHLPEIKLNREAEIFLARLREANIPLGLITDGRSITQRNKLRALGIEGFFSEIIISEEFGSEKPDKRNFLYFEDRYPTREFWFVGDNTTKDFIVPVSLGWKTICIKDSGNNIHPQRFDLQAVPQYCVSSFAEIRLQ
jgi:putative hydrolase of the HAD superfamily